MVGKDLIMATLLGSGGGSSGSGGGIDAMIDGSITEVSSDTVGSVHQYAFYYCRELATVDFPKARTIGNSAFHYCDAMTTLNLPEATRLGSKSIQNCSSLTRLDFPNVTLAETYAFSNCSALTAVNLPVADSIAGYMFAQCIELTEVRFPKAKRIDNYAFQSCYKLSTADFPAVGSIDKNAFYSCNSLTAVILRKETLCSLANTNAFNSCYHILGTVNATYNPDGLADGYIYVPRALVDTYKAATNWSTFANQFRVLEDYTVDGTITGELDESKI